MPVATARARLRDVAQEQHGYVTTRDAHTLAIDTNVLHQLTHRGFLENVGRGVYRFMDWPRSKVDEFMEAVLIVGPQAYLLDTSVLDLIGLAEVSQDVIRVGTRRRARVSTPPNVELIRDNHPADLIVTFDGVPIVRPDIAIIDSQDRVMTERLEAAAREAAARGLIGEREARQVLVALKSSGP